MGGLLHLVQRELQHTFISAVSPAVRNSLFSKTVTGIVVVADVIRYGQYREEASDWD